MIQIWKWIKNNPNRAMFLLPILLVAGISISHVVSWYDMANPINWAIYLSIAIEVGAITALVAATNRIKGGIWFMFGLVTFIQMVGNIFYSYKEIDANGELFKSWVELTGPIWELMGTELTDIVGMKRWLAFLEGGLLPIISLTSLHFFVKYEKPKEEKEEDWKEELSKRPITPMPPPTGKVFYTNPIEEKEEEVEEISEVTEIESLVEEEESKAKRVKAPTSPSTDSENYFDNYPIPVNEEENSEIIQSEEDAEVFVNEIEDPTPPNEILENALKKYKESRGDMEKITPKELKDRIVNQPPKPPKTNIKRID